MNRLDVQKRSANHDRGNGYNVVKLAGLILAFSAIGGCATVHKMDRGMMSKFEMLSPTEWRMTASTAASYPPESAKAEAIRKEWIEQYTKTNGCSSFTVSNRIWTKTPSDSVVASGFSKFTDSVGTLLYTGTCDR